MWQASFYFVMTHAQKHIFLLGMPGAGKTTTGKLLAETLKFAFLDSDREIEKKTGLSIEAIFEKNGEMFFREQEASFIASLESGPYVVATGGGMPVHFDNLEKLKSKGVLIYLYVPVFVLYSRIMNQKHARPLLKPSAGVDLQSILQATFDLRNPIYTRSDFVVDAEQRPELVVNNIVNMLQNQEYGNW